MEELQICVDERNWEVGIREILEKIRPNWKNEKITFKVNHHKKRHNLIIIIFIHLTCAVQQSV